MTRHYILIAFVLSCSAALSSCRNGSEHLSDGLYFLAESDHDKSIPQFKSFKDQINWTIDPNPLLTTDEFQIKFHYDSVIYFDTFMIAELLPTKSGQKKWQHVFDNFDSERSNIGLVVNDTVLHWTTISSTYVEPSISLCYCDYSLDELNTIEEKIKKN